MLFLLRPIYGCDVGTRTGRNSVTLASLALILAACSASDRTPQESSASGSSASNGAVASDVNLFRTGRTLVIPHGGGDGLFPENTMYAYEQSQAMGGDVIDIDVRIAADGVLIAFHDSTLDRTTNASGPVGALTSIELAGLDAGHDFEIDGDFPFRDQGIGVPTVEEILRAFPETLTTLDLKIAGSVPVQPVCNLLRELGRTDDVYVGTESNDQPELFRTACPEVSTSGTSEERQIRRAAHDAGQPSSPVAQLVSQPRYMGNDGQPRFNAEYLEFAQSSDTAVLTWVIDDRETLTELIEMGIDGIYTRRPDIMIDILDELGLPHGDQLG